MKGATMYYVISNSDGDTTVEPMTKEELLRRLKDGDWSDWREWIPPSRLIRVSRELIR